MSDNAHAASPRARYVLLLVSTGVLLSRVPAIRYSAELNPDESVMIAQALRYQLDLVPWRAVDGTTGGPLDSWFLLAAHWLGMPLQYSPVHLLAALSLCGIVVAAYWAARNAFGRGPAAIAAISGGLWLALNQRPDFTHYSGEIVPCLLLAGALALGTAGTRESRWAALRLAATGMLIGSAPWAKLQAGPIAALLGVWMVARVWSSDDDRWRRLAALIAGAVVPSAAILALVWAGGAWTDFWSSYVLGNLYYAGHNGVAGLAYFALLIAGTGQLAGPWLLTAGAVWSFAALRRIAEGTGRVTVLTSNQIGAVLLTAAALYVCAAPQFHFDHHQLFLVAPLVVLTAAAIELAFGPHVAIWGTPEARRRLAVCATVWGMYAATQAFPAYRDARELAPPVVSDAQRLLDLCRQVAPNFRTIGVWGWFPSVYVTLGQAPPTRHAVPHYLYTNNPYEDVLHQSFMRDLTASRPDLMLELVAGGDRAYAVDPAPFPALAEYLRTNYEVAWSGAAPFTADSGTLRIHVRKAR